jgi:hypothetical protein
MHRQEQLAQMPEWLQPNSFSLALLPRPFAPLGSLGILRRDKLSQGQPSSLFVALVFEYRALLEDVARDHQREDRLWLRDTRTIKSDDPQIRSNGNPLHC